MRRTRWTFVAAVACLALAFSRPDDGADSGPRVESLDFTGITQLRVVSAGKVEVAIGGGAPRVSLGRHTDAKAVVTRDGDTLVVRIDAGANRWHGAEVVVPAWLQRIDARAPLAVEAKRPVERMQVSTVAPFAWEGGAARLEVVRRSHVDTDAGHDDAGACGCSDEGTVDIEGRIDDLVVTADVGRVYVDRERGYGHVTLDLAEGITIDIENALDLTGGTVRRRPPTDDAAVKASATGAAAPEATP